MILEFAKMSPAQNTTVLVTSYCPKCHYHTVSNKIMGYEFLNAEQVGFILPPTSPKSILRLEMAGGEFCGNAVLSAAAYINYKGITDSDNFYIDTSGSNKIMSCGVRRLDISSYNVSCTMPAAKQNEGIVLQAGDQIIEGQLIIFDGISHFVYHKKVDSTDYAHIIAALKKETNTDAIGVIPYSKLEEYKYKIRPFVHVRRLNTNVFEKGCGSGTLALGKYLKKASGVSGEIEVIQPGGIINVKTNNPFTISTDVTLTCEGRVLI